MGTVEFYISFMSSINQVSEDIINRTPYLRDLLTENIINLSALARKIQPEIENFLGEKCNEGAVVMSIRRIVSNLPLNSNAKTMEALHHFGNFKVRMDLSSYTIENSPSLKDKELQFLTSLNQDPSFRTFFCRGMNESTYILSSNHGDKFIHAFKDERILTTMTNLAFVGMNDSSVFNGVVGAFAHIFKLLAMAGVNVVEIMTTQHEFNIIVNGDDVDKAMKTLLGLFRED